MSRKEKPPQEVRDIFADLCAGETGDREGIWKLRQKNVRVPYDNGVRIRVGDRYVWVNYHSPRVWAAYTADGRPVGEYVDGKLQTQIDAAIAQQRADT